jgi:glycine/D-amino acid oxidase-like deaminating enzyme
MTGDGLPHVHRLADGVYAWLGCNGRGVALATALGSSLADAVRGVPEDSLPVPFVPLAPIAAHGLAERLARFALLAYRWRDGRG